MRSSPARYELKSAEQLRGMRAAGLLTGQILLELESRTVPGITTAALDEMARLLLAEAGATSSFLGYDGGAGVPKYPAVTCISTNEEVVHGIPSSRVLVAGDVVSIDFGAILHGWHGDSARTICVGETPSELQQLSIVTKQAMWDGIAAIAVGKRIGDIGHAIAHSIRSQKTRYGLVREFTGHGIGSQMHMDPDVPNYGWPGRGPRIQSGMCLAIEPIVSMGLGAVTILDDGWTAVTRDSSVAAHWEHTVAITKAGISVLTALDQGIPELESRGVACVDLD